MQSSSILLPDFASHTCFATRFNRYCNRVAVETKHWIFKENSGMIAGLTPRLYDTQKFTLLASVCYPDAAYPQLRLCSDFLAYFFYLDDLTDDMDNGSTQSVAKHIMCCLNHPSFRSPFRIGKMTTDYFRRIMQTSSTSVQQRFITTMSLFLTSVDQQAQDRAMGHIPEIEEYIKHRRETSGCRTCFVLIEYANNLCIPDEVLRHPIISEMENAANDVVSFANDVYSFNQEQFKGDNHNMIVVLIHNSPNMSLEEAVKYVADRTYMAMDYFNQLKATLPKWGPKIDTEVGTYINGLQNWMGGVFFWSFETERYFGKEVERVKMSKSVVLLNRPSKNK
ncbi:isoprenoid synthase domain-containing protein [Lentinula edodes]|nr:isoprenoid synthase domain-containing protein [Lentinula edodes]